MLPVPMRIYRANTGRGIKFVVFVLTRSPRTGYARSVESRARAGITLIQTVTSVAGMPFAGTKQSCPEPKSPPTYARFRGHSRDSFPVFSQDRRVVETGGLVPGFFPPARNIHVDSRFYTHKTTGLLSSKRVFNYGVK